LEHRVSSYHLENQGPSVSEHQVPTTPFEERGPTLERQVLTPLEQPPHSPLKEQVSPPLKEKITLVPAEQQQHQQDDARNVWEGMVEEPESSLKAAEEEVAQLKIPGSFDMEAETPPPHQQAYHSWIDMLRLKQVILSSIGRGNFFWLTYT